MPYITVDEVSDSHAHYYLAMAYQTGDGVPFDLRESERLLKLAVAAGHVEATMVLARQYLHGVNVEKNLVEGARLYYNMAILGNANAQFELANLYIMGIGIEKNIDLAIDYWKKSAINGHGTAHNALLLFLTSTNDKVGLFKFGHSYRKKGQTDKAIEVWHKGAELNDPKCQYELGTILYSGQRRSEGADWLQKAADAGYVEAKNTLETIYSLPSDNDSVDSVS
jgi:TPR repeat protein